MSSSSSLLSSRISSLNAGRLQQPLPEEEKRVDYTSQLSNSSFPSRSSSPPVTAESLTQHTPPTGHKWDDGQDRSCQILTSSSWTASRPSPADFDSVSSQLKTYKDRLSTKIESPKQLTSEKSAGMDTIQREQKNSAFPGSPPSPTAARVALPAKSPYVKYFESRTYDTSDWAQNASRRRRERVVLSGDNVPPATGEFQEQEMDFPAHSRICRTSRWAQKAARRRRERIERWDSSGNDGKSAMGILI
jgi:hypothetical protein